MRLLVRVVLNLMGRRSYWTPDLGNIYGIVISLPLLIHNQLIKLHEQDVH
jgi:hypothetical protein